MGFIFTVSHLSEERTNGGSYPIIFMSLPVKSLDCVFVLLQRIKERGKGLITVICFIRSNIYGY